MRFSLLKVAFEDLDKQIGLRNATLKSLAFSRMQEARGVIIKKKNLQWPST